MDREQEYKKRVDKLVGQENSAGNEANMMNELEQNFAQIFGTAEKAKFPYIKGQSEESVTVLGIYPDRK